MRIGLVGKPNVGKSTTFSALTQTPVDIANYPFTTIDPNVGVAWIPLREPCACSALRANVRLMEDLNQYQQMTHERVAYVLQILVLALGTID